MMIKFIIIIIIVIIIVWSSSLVFSGYSQPVSAASHSYMSSIKDGWNCYYFISRLSMIARVNVVLNRTVVVDSDWRFVNLCGSHLQS